MNTYILHIMERIGDRVQESLVFPVCYASPLILSALVTDTTKTGMTESWHEHLDIVKVALVSCISVITWVIVEYIKANKDGFKGVNEKLDVLSEKLHLLIGEHNANHGGK